MRRRRGLQLSEQMRGLPSPRHGRTSGGSPNGWRFLVEPFKRFAQLAGGGRLNCFPVLSDARAFIIATTGRRVLPSNLVQLDRPDAGEEPLVVAVRGGRTHGGAVLTATGRKALKLYQQIEKDCLEATTTRWKGLKSLLRD